MRRINKLWGVIWLWGGILSVNQVWAQDFLLLKHIHKDRIVVVEPGLRVVLSLKGESLPLSGQLVGIFPEDSTIWLQEDIGQPTLWSPASGLVVEPRAILLEEIDVLTLPEGRKSHLWRDIYNQSSLLIGGVIIGGSATETLVSGEPPHISSIIAASSILTSGLLVKYLPRRRYVLNRKWYLEAMAFPEKEKLSQK